MKKKNENSIICSTKRDSLNDLLFSVKLALFIRIFLYSLYDDDILLIYFVISDNELCFLFFFFNAVNFHSTINLRNINTKHLCRVYYWFWCVFFRFAHAAHIWNNQSLLYLLVVFFRKWRFCFDVAITSPVRICNKITSIDL